ncbi:DUF2497 domain-containing protein [Candidatus Nucleicultrix amoebiphila]|jgi:cell pole-organizing protein PopZ|uniref:DUF2497 domain-containing protein n=1 Tax=Candidatus Nucleicultrix amoebiphila FS5 TaxID=1414854 RepID=A0A1W6N4B2_9PROT|nr:DUF2497 domain-containing protein [Candidatus Nucleicultrix amoebiphila]ARN84684.1 hypothetical protein GQ61_04480 [Candidatus Nucleicultrix amoebiphila FS5]
MKAPSPEDQKVEEILTSIRSIIAEDIHYKTGKPMKKTDPSLPLPSNKKAILELTDMVQQDGSVVNLKQDIVSSPSIETTSPEKISPRPTPVSQKTSTPLKGDYLMKQKEDILAQETTAKLQESFDQFKSVIQNPEMPHQAPPIHSGNIGSQTFESIIHQMLQPMLKEWLDAHLPTIVKFLVSEQIEKIKNKK